MCGFSPHFLSRYNKKECYNPDMETYNYIEKLREHRLKATPQRTAIAEALDTYGHLSVEELYELLKRRFHSLSLATIYKNINIMKENEFVAEVKLPEQKSVFELKKEAHSHLQCRSCNRVWDLMLDLDDIIAQASKKSAFAIEEANLVFSGLCDRCKNAQ